MNACDVNKHSEFKAKKSLNIKTNKYFFHPNPKQYTYKKKKKVISLT